MLNHPVFLSSQEHLDGMVGTGLLTQLTALLEVKDPLTRLNAVELVTALALTHQGIRFRPMFLCLCNLIFLSGKQPCGSGSRKSKRPTKIEKS
jgi:hypothetical protein